CAAAMRIRGRAVRASGIGISLAFVGCGQAKPRPIVAPPVPAPVVTTAPASLELDAGVVDGAPAPDVEVDATIRADAPPEAAPVSNCPNGMILVDTTYCPRVERKCIEEEYSPQNKITICHKFSTAQRCLGELEHRRFCIDEYEYPNQKGAHPPWMVSWY